MKTILKVFLLLFFSSLVPLFIFLLTLRSSRINGPYLKSQFSKTNLYEKLASELETFIDDNQENGSKDDPMHLIGPFLKQEVTASYIKIKLETLIDDTDTWIRNTSAKEPVLSLSDLRDKLVLKHANIISQIEELQESVKSQKPEIEKIAKESGDPEQQAQLDKIADFDLASFLKKDMTFPLGQYLTPIRLLSFWSSTGLFVLGVLLVSVLLVIYLTSDNDTLKYRWVGVTLILSSLFSVVPVLAFSAVTAFILPGVLIDNSIPEFLLPLFQIFITPLTDNFTWIGAVVLGSLFIIGFVCLILPLFFNKAAPVAKKTIPILKKPATKRNKRK
jgi:hypothetical protein